MTFLPIVDHELRVQARQKRTFRLRLANAGAAMAIIGYLLWLNDGLASRGSPAHRVFTVIAWLGFLYCLLGGAAHTADCLSEEKREGTLGLLFLTDLRGYDVVLGKMLATSLKNLYALIAVFPPLGITLCLGGVTAGEFWRLVLLLTCTLLFSLAVGMFVSAVSREEQGAWAGTAALLALLAVAPALAFRGVFDAAYSFSPGVYWNGLLAVPILSCLLLAGASVVLPRAWQETGVASGGRHFSGLLAPSWWLRSGSRWRREHLLTFHPLQWLARKHTGRAVLYLWTVVDMAAAVGVVAAVIGPRTMPIVERLCGCALALHFLLASWAAFQASSLFAEARRVGTLELLLATPLTPAQIIDGHYLGLRRVFAKPIAVLISAESAILAGEVAALVIVDHEYSKAFSVLLCGGACIILFVTDLLAVGSFGLWMGLTSKTPGHAFMSTVVYVMVLPFFCTLLMPPIWWFKNAFFRKYTQEHLRQHFRTLVTEGGPIKWQPGRLPSV